MLCRPETRVFRAEPTRHARLLWQSAGLSSRFETDDIFPGFRANRRHDFGRFGFARCFSERGSAALDFAALAHRANFHRQSVAVVENLGPAQTCRRRARRFFGHLRAARFDDDFGAVGRRFGVGIWAGFWALQFHFDPVVHSWGEALYIAGVSLLTIGYGDYTPTDGMARVFALTAGASGLAVFALVISLLFTLYTAFERREVLSLTLDARAGSPPSGVMLLERYSQLGLLDTLPQFFEQWEQWSAQVLQSHIAYPILPFFRSSHDGESWIASLGAVLDSATLLITTIAPCENCGRLPIGSAQLMFRMGTHTVIDLSHWFGFRFDEDETPPVGVERSEFEAARARLAKAGFALRPAELSWEDFQHKRSQYAAGLNELAKHFAAPPAQWVGDRSMLNMKHRAPAARAKTKSP